MFAAAGATAASGSTSRYQAAAVVASDGVYADAIRVDWQAGYTAEFYEVFRSASPDGPFVLICRTEDLFCIDVGLEPGQEFWYRVAARNLCGGSGRTEAIHGATTYGE